MDPKLKREIILEHYQNPVNKGLIDNDGYVRVNTRNSSCVDNIDMMVKIKDGVIEDARFDGEACAICTSATSIMIRSIIGKNIDQVDEIVCNFEKMINEEEYDDSVLQELNVYNDIYKQPSRKKCALLPFESIKKVINTK
ncbi:MAG: Fe-S cluster assembly sulfur transfer protein SufU [Bacilli bacterium]